jgi:histone H1/5
MTTSYVLEKQEELKAIKKLERQAEKLIRDKEEAAKKAAAKADSLRLAAKMARINGDEVAQAAAEKEIAANAKVEMVAPAPVEMERARDDKGHYVADDPSTPDINEAFVPKKTAPKKKVAPKKKAAAKPKAKARSKK